MLAERPGSFRLEVLSPFGTVALAASDGREFAVYARRESRVYRGPAGPGSVGAYAAVPLEVADVVTVLLGAPPGRAATGAATVGRDDDAGLIHLAVPIETGIQEVWFAPETLHPVRSATPLPDGRILYVSFGDWKQVGALAFPYRIDLRAEPGNDAVHVRYGSPSLNTDIADHLFGFPPRSGVEELRIEQYPVSGTAS